MTVTLNQFESMVSFQSIVIEYIDAAVSEYVVTRPVTRTQYIILS